jgi:pimeloyl-ACP methyl ester carboxylesterase
MSAGADLSPEKSTIVRSCGEGPRQRLGALAVSVLSHVAPGAAARIAERRYLTPPRFPAPERERAILAGARSRALRVDGRHVATWSWGAGPTILLVHGWGGRGAQLGAFVAPLVAQGFSVTTFDAPGHGASGGRLATFPAMAAALGAVAETEGPVRGIVAHSGGGAVSVWALHQWLLRGHVDLPDALALIAPPSDFVAYFDRFVAGARLSALAARRLRARLEARLGLPLEAFEVGRLVRGLPQAALVVHDRGDREVAWAEGAAVAAGWRGARLVTTEGLGHRRILRDPDVVERVARFLGARLRGAAASAPEDRAREAVLC